MADRGAIALPAIRAGHVASAYCQRDWRVHLRSPLAIGGMLAGPLLLLLAIGIGLGSAIGGGAQHQILKVIVPGLVGMGVVLATSQRSIAVFSDRTSGLTDEIVAGPVTVRIIVLAQTLSSTTIATLQGLAVFALAAMLGLAVVPAHWLVFLIALVAFAFACAATCNAMGLMARRPGSIQALLNLVVNPLFFLSGALFDVSATATPIRVIALLNPFHYGVRLLQDAYNPGGLELALVPQSAAVLIGVAIVALLVSARSLRRR
jgi:ABC-2 type transport system permease protein